MQPYLALLFVQAHAYGVVRRAIVDEDIPHAIRVILYQRAKAGKHDESAVRSDSQSIQISGIKQRRTVAIAHRPARAGEMNRLSRFSVVEEKILLRVVRVIDVLARAIAERDKSPVRREIGRASCR